MVDLCQKEKIRVVCISDTHTHTENLILPKGDILIHAGDFTYTGLKDELIGFNEFLKKQTHFKYKIVIAGNHEVTFDEEEQESLRKMWKKYKNSMLSSKESKALLTDCIYLENSGVELFGYKFWGSPMITYYSDWGFYRNDEKLKENWKKIPDGIDVLITHSPPRTVMDYSVEIEQNEGCRFLYEEVVNRVKPKYHIFGHTHEGYGAEEINGINFINAAICDVDYNPVNKPIIFDLEIKK